MGAPCRGKGRGTGAWRRELIGSGALAALAGAIVVRSSIERSKHTRLRSTAHDRVPLEKWKPFHLLYTRELKVRNEIQVAASAASNPRWAAYDT